MKRDTKVRSMLKKRKDAKKNGPTNSPVGGHGRRYRPKPCSVKHFCRPSSRIRRELSHDKVCSRSKSRRRRYNVGTGRGQRCRRRSKGCGSTLWEKMQEFVLQRMRDEARQQGAEAVEPEQERGEQDSEPGARLLPCCLSVAGPSPWRGARQQSAHGPRRNGWPGH